MVLQPPGIWSGNKLPGSNSHGTLYSSAGSWKIRVNSVRQGSGFIYYVAVNGLDLKMRQISQKYQKITLFVKNRVKIKSILQE